ncbi:hypothetical protein FA15DRAFT_347584 [Coprinopsis marcescibilis]|uniref:Uncharacterized protein n=1 Tax=Coprinopsis marcescibilis TaxID=230819 RepID=A0A5C3LA27_COPMA|nr:hypothetical protein FA15DRAFT_347584 [Coprinopsis marcescibilis]
MAVLTKVASGMKRRIPSSTGGAQQVAPRQQHPVSQAPDLKRWSDFMNPFPPVGPGGYTKYYKSKNGAPTNLHFQLPPLCHINYFTSPQPKPSPKAPSQSSRKFHSRPDKGNLHKLTSIPESTLEIPDLQAPQSPTSTIQSPGGSLRRRKRRLLRTPSIEREFADARALFASQTDLGRSGSTSSSHSSTTQRTHLSSSSDSDDLNFSPTSTESDMPLTPRDDSIQNDHHFNYLTTDPYVKRRDVYEGVLGEGGEEEGYHSFQRPESWATYRTARSQFSEV